MVQELMARFMPSRLHTKPALTTASERAAFRTATDNAGKERLIADMWTLQAGRSTAVLAREYVAKVCEWEHAASSIIPAKLVSYSKCTYHCWANPHRRWKCALSLLARALVL